MATATVIDRRDAQDVQILDEGTLDPNMHYRWVREDANNIASKRTKGYRFVTDADGVKTLMEQEDRKADGYLRIGDLILMCCEKQRYLQREEVVRNTTERRLGAPEAQFEAEARRRPYAGQPAQVLTESTLKKLKGGGDE